MVGQRDEKDLAELWNLGDLLIPPYQERGRLNTALRLRKRQSELSNYDVSKIYSQSGRQYFLYR
jgi:hypothetical protein